jgi:xanthine dehydrogenase accessory factor
VRAQPRAAADARTIARMSEITDVLAAIESLAARGERMALATIVAVRGSTYRRPGARLLVPEDGAPVGNISGGCLEGDVADMARVVMDEGRARLAGWDLTADDDAVWGLGLGCNGAIEVFIEPADRAAEVAGALRRALEDERPICVVTVVESGLDAVAPGARIVVAGDGDPEGSLGDAGVDAEAQAAALELLAAERSEVRTFAGGVRAFVEVLEPPVRLVICGAGHDAIPLVRAASVLGWSAVVVDDREAFLTLDRFPEAAGFLHVGSPDDAATAAAVDRRTFVVVMTHNFLRDKAYLRSLLGSPAAYVGMLGPAARTQRLLMELADEGVEVDSVRGERIHGPAGLDLGSEGPEEIAQSILAEIVAVRRGRHGGFLRERPGPIHDRPRPGAAAR